MARSLRPFEAFPITTRHLEVIRTADVTPGMRRVTLGGDQLKAFTAENGYPVADFRSDGFDDEFKIFLKHPDAEEAVGTTQLDGVLDWPRDNPHLLFRTYTARRWDWERGELDVDFVIHGIGPATSWARTVRPGERIQIAGPKSSAGHPDGADWVLVAGDETALPAIGRWLEDDWPEGQRGQVFIEIAEDAHRQDLSVPEGVELTWLSRNGAEPGTTTLLYDAITGADWWEGKVFAWVAGETLTLTPIRRWLRNEKGLAKDQVEVTGYWRRQEVKASEEDPTIQDLDATEDESEKFHELAEIIPGHVLRTAMTLGVPQALADGMWKTPTVIAQERGLHPVGTAKLLRYLAAIEIVEANPDGAYSLTTLGRELENDHIADALDLGGPQAAKELGILALTSAVRTGTGDYSDWFGLSYEERMLSETSLIDARAENEAEFGSYVSGVTIASALIQPAKTLLVVGKAAGVFAEEFVRHDPERRATVRARPSELEAIKRLTRTDERISFEPGSLLETAANKADAVLLVDPLGPLPDADAVHALVKAAAAVEPNGAVYLFCDPLEEAEAHDHDLEDDLIDFALSGGGSRTHEEYERLFERAGLEISGRETVGWGDTLYRLANRSA
ncbi:MAG: SIP domain-containing protein [Brevibacterium aurantiacum]|uniref:Siderophore-interacting protein n=1 Tax=Brevibacterium aurantiacum TaxID=273384 RepID=A0A2A3YPK5_BREAU|nr:siderophore-interacting protein [Brevibacterium aurantiacum]AZT97656.1 siderophore-interacting protein [Brevibacterium aurantiacum]PCC41211.1 siderophore-interacting protein [Brevibacterium aurantiacum]